MSPQMSATSLRKRQDVKKNVSSSNVWKSWRNSDAKMRSRNREWLQSERQESRKKLTFYVVDRERMRL